MIKLADVIKQMPILSWTMPFIDQQRLFIAKLQVT